MRRKNDLTDLQKQIIEILSKVEHPHTHFKHTDVTGRCIAYWISGQRQPKDITAIQEALQAVGYEMVIRKKAETNDDCQWW